MSHIIVNTLLSIDPWPYVSFLLAGFIVGKWHE